MRSSAMRSSAFDEAGTGSTSEKRCPRAAAPANSPVRYSFCSAVKPAETRGSGSAAFISIDVPLVSLLGFQFRHVTLGVFSSLAARLLDDFMQRGIHILGHARGIATDVEMRAGFEPRPQFR